MSKSLEIYHGDSLEVMKKLKDNTIDLCITSPPYANIKKYIDWCGIHPDNYVEWILPFIKELYRILKPSGTFILNINDCVKNKCRHTYIFELVYRITKELGFKLYERLFWNKLKGLPNKKRFGDRVEYIFIFCKDVEQMKINIDDMRVPYSQTSIKRMNKPIKARYSRTENDDDKKYKNWKPNPKGALPTTLINISSETKKIADSHIAVYPVELCNYFIKGFSNENDLILDIFAGTGTTGLSCKELNRNCILIEKEKEYCNIIKQRLNNV